MQIQRFKLNNFVPSPLNSRVHLAMQAPWGVLDAEYATRPARKIRVGRGAGSTTPRRRQRLICVQLELGMVVEVTLVEADALDLPGELVAFLGRGG